MAEAINEGSHYYTLTYTPANLVMDGKYRRIGVKCKMIVTNWPIVAGATRKTRPLCAKLIETLRMILSYHWSASECLILPRSCTRCA